MDYDAIIELLIGHGYILSDDKERATILLRKANYPEPPDSEVEANFNADMSQALKPSNATSAKGEADELHRAICALNENMPLGLEWAMDIVRDTLLAARRPSAEPVCPECGIKLPGHFYTCSKAPWGKDGES